MGQFGELSTRLAGAAGLHHHIHAEQTRFVRHGPGVADQPPNSVGGPIEGIVRLGRLGVPHLAGDARLRLGWHACFRHLDGLTVRMGDLGNLQRRLAELPAAFIRQPQQGGDPHPGVGHGSQQRILLGLG